MKKDTTMSTMFTSKVKTAGGGCADYHKAPLFRGADAEGNSLRNKDQSEYGEGKIIPRFETVKTNIQEADL